MAPVELISQHLGALHPIETVLVFLIAFGPFVVLLAVVYHRRKQDLAEEEQGPQR